MEITSKIENKINCNLHSCFFLQEFNYPFFIGILDEKNKDFLSFKINSSLPVLLSYEQDYFDDKFMLPVEIWDEPNEREIFVYNLIEARQLKNYIVRLKTKNNEVFYGNIHVNLIEIKGNTFAAGFCNDITVRFKLFEELEKKTYELMEKNKIISFSAKTIVHEISNYIMPIINHSETSLIKVYQDKYSKEETIDMLKDFIKISKNILNFNKKYSDLLKENEYTHSKSINKFNILNLIKNVAALNSLALLDKRVDINYNLTPYTVLAIKDDIKIVLMNLIGNAIKFSPIGGTVKIESKELDNNVVQINIINKGQILEEKINRLFLSYERDINSISIPGHGIGLCISYNILQNHNQKIGAKNIDEENVLFYFTLERWCYNGNI